MKERNLLLIIDLQNDFIEGGSLAVPKSNEVVDYLTQLVCDKVSNIADICLTRDAHPADHISFAESWTGDIKPFDKVSIDDVKSGKYYFKKPYKTGFFNRLFGNRIYNYLEDLKEPLTVWPTHCVVNTEGYKAPKHFNEMVKRWEIINDTEVKILNKGQYQCEMYSAFSCYTGLPNTIDKNLLNYFHRFDKIYVAGLAKDYCVYYSLLDMVRSGLKDRIVILRPGIAAIDPFNKEVNNFYNTLKHGEIL